VHFDNTEILISNKCTLYYTYKMLKCTVKISHDCSYMFRSTWTINREPTPNLAEVTILWKYSVKIRRYMFSNVGKNCFKLWCVVCTVCRAVCDWVLLIFLLFLICCMLCWYLLCRVLCVIVVIICLIFLSSRYRNVFCIFGSICLMAFSVSIISSLM
jgi:hypothetical protein